MIHRITRVPVVGLLAVVALLSACGEGSKYAGDWKRELYGEGDVQMKLASNGGVELMLPSPRWPDSVDMKGRANFTGDTLVFKADTTVTPCQTADARYVVNRTENELHIAGVGMDPCGGRRAALVGTWTKEVKGTRSGGGSSPFLHVRVFGRPLLCDAMEGAQSPHQIGAVDPDDVPAREEPRERGLRLLVPAGIVGGE